MEFLKEGGGSGSSKRQVRRNFQTDKRKRIRLEMVVITRVTVGGTRRSLL